jgi:hypothetical protein
LSSGPLDGLSMWATSAACSTQRLSSA